MEWEKYEEKIRQKCKDDCRTEAFTKKYIQYAKTLFDKGLPVISSPSHFSMLVGMNHDYVCSMARAPAKFYRDFEIKKSNGKRRIISEPLPDLKFVQHWILQNILEKCPVSIYAKAFIKGKTLKSNAKFHRSQKVVVTMDVKDFFPSISFYGVFSIYLDMGYSKSVSRFLSNLCCYHESLPQGAPTSPYLSNLYMRKFDSEVTEYISAKHIRYTRYADDLTFSGDINPHYLIHDISCLLYKYGLKINAQKTRVAYQSARQEVTGIVVNSHLQIPKNKRKEIRQQVYYIKKFGLDSHLNHIQEVRSNYLNHLLGQINYALFINPKDEEMKTYYSYIKEIMKERKNTT